MWVWLVVLIHGGGWLVVVFVGFGGCGVWLVVVFVGRIWGLIDGGGWLVVVFVRFGGCGVRFVVWSRWFGVQPEVGFSGGVQIDGGRWVADWQGGGGAGWRIDKLVLWKGGVA